MNNTLQGNIINLIIDEEGKSRMGYFGGQLKEAANQYQFTSPCISKLWKITELHSSQRNLLMYVCQSDPKYSPSSLTATVLSVSPK